MVSFTRFFVAVSAAASALAAPAPAADPDAPDFELGGGLLEARQDYTQNYKTGGTVTFTSSSNGYSVTFSGASDFVVGKGWKTGTTTRNITFTGSTSATAGSVLVAVYGWSTNPLIEYYVQEYSNGNGAAQGTKVGSVVSDGSTYDIYKHQQVNQPSIVATSSTFMQYISVRQTKRASGGTVTMANHVNAWKSLGLSLGTMNYQTVATEGFNSAAGSSKYTVSATS